MGEQHKNGKTEPVIVIKLPVPDKPDTYTHQRMQPKHIAKLGAHDRHTAYCSRLRASDILAAVAQGPRKLR